MLLLFEATLQRMAPRYFAASLVFFTFAFSAAAQRTGGPPTGPTNPGLGSSSSATLGVGPTLNMGSASSVIVRVLGSHNAPLQQESFVQLYKQGSGTPLTGTLTQGNSQAAFSNLPGEGWYTVEVSAAGYRTQRQDFEYMSTHSYNEIVFIMEPDPEDPSTTYKAAVPLPSKAQKHIDKGVAEFRGGELKNAEKEFLAAYAIVPQSAETNYLLGLVYLHIKDFQHSEQYFTKALAIDADNVPALIGLGHVRYQKGDDSGAADALQKAVTIDGKQWEGFWALSEVHFRLHGFEKAQKEAEKAVELGKGAANGAEFVEGEALAGLGRSAEALKMLQAFLKDVPSDPNAPTARQLCTRLEAQITAKPAEITAQPGDSLFAEAMPQPNLSPAPPSATSAHTIATTSSAFPAALPKLPIVDWEPVGVDDEKLLLASGVTCPADKVIAETGKRVSEFVDSVNRIDATELITHEQLTTLGRPINIERRKFDYLISISAEPSGFLTIDENRQGRDAESGFFLDHISMFGLADLPLVFHPSMRGDFQLTCEGLGRWQDRATWIVYFRQRADRPERLRSYSLQDSSYTVGIKGRAWISADTYQIVRLEANLMKPIPQIGLGSEEDVVEYGPVPFRTKRTTLWLPSNADIYYYYRHRPFHRHHVFSNYNLFSVSASEKIGQPNIPDEKDNEKNNQPH